MDKKIDVLPDVVGLSGSEFVILDDGTVTSKATVNKIIALVTKVTLGLAAVENTSDLDKVISTAVAAALLDKVDKTALTALQTTVTGQGTTIALKADKTDLTNVDNIADAAKPVSTLQAAAIALKEDKTVVAALAVRVAALEGRIAAAQADSTAADVPGLVADFNGLLAKLKTAGLVA